VLQAPGRFLKIALRNPRNALRFVPFLIRRIINTLGLRATPSTYAIDPTVLLVPDIESLERMIDFSGFSIETAYSRAARMAYHCRKVAEFDPVFAANGKYRDAERITNF
jgi:hypothetical protein